MSLSYNRLWKLLIDKKINKSQLHNLTGISKSTLSKLTKGENVNTDILDNICSFLNCKIEDIVEFLPKEERHNFSVGSVCSGIEAASVAWTPLGISFRWFSEIADFPCKILKEKYPNIPNVGDMNNIPTMLLNHEIEDTDIICAGTPCQSFSLAGLQQGLNDERGNLTLKFAKIIEANDSIRKKKGKEETIVFWENVEGVLTDKTNAFGCLVSFLAGLKEPFECENWPSSGVIYGTKRNVAWRVIDAKFFGVPQQRKRLYLVAGGINFHPENVLFEFFSGNKKSYPDTDLIFEKDGSRFEIFRSYTDCLYAAYGTKWNGNAAATNGSLFVVQNDRIRRLSPIEAERLMGFPDNYTYLENAKKTSRYQAIGNSWVVPVIKWIGERINDYTKQSLTLSKEELLNSALHYEEKAGTIYFPLGKGLIRLMSGTTINCSSIPEECTYGDMKDIVSIDAPEDIYISPVGCYGIIRRKEERHISINKRLEEVLLAISSNMSHDEIEKKSKVQKRGKLSN